MKVAKPVVVALIAVAPWSCALRLNTCLAQTATEVTERREQVASLSPSAKRELLQNKERFDQLPQDEQARLRHLDAQISGHPRAAEIRGVLERYGQWLASLSATERAELQMLDTDKRLARIQELRQGEQNRRLSKCGLTPLDANTVYQWWDQFADEHQDRLVKLMDDRERRAYEEMSDDNPRRVHLLRGSVWQSFDRLLADMPPENTNSLIDRLSVEARERYLSKNSTKEKDELLEKWLRESILYRMRPPPATDADLQRMSERLPPEERKELERLPRDEVTRILRERWENQQMWWGMRSLGGFHRGFDNGRGPRDRGDRDRSRGGPRAPGDDRPSRGHDDDRADRDRRPRDLREGDGEHGDRRESRDQRRHEDGRRERPDFDGRRPEKLERKGEPSAPPSPSSTGDET